jgi:Tol biopolymer transport system component
LHSIEPSLINTDFAKRCNNDHVLSFVGKYLGISNNGTKEKSGESIIYVLPVTGGIPQQVTMVGPSYLHGWSPDRTTLVYCAQRDNKFDIYSIPVTGGTEKRLTDAEGLMMVQNIHRWKIYLFQFKPNRQHADLENEARWI